MIDIPNVGPVEATNAASESTLQELVKALTGNKNGSSTGGAGGSSGGSGMPTKEVKSFGKEIAETTTFVDDLGDAASSASKGLLGFAVGAVSSAIGAMTNFGSALMLGTGKMGELGSAIPLIGGPLGALGNMLDTQVDTFRTVAETGASFGNDILGATKAAANAGLTLDQFTQVVTQNSDSLALLGGSQTEGAKRFGEVSKALRTSRLGDQLFNMGYSMEGINEGFLNYTEEMARQGRLSGMTNAQLVEGSASYMKELDELAKTTGKTREELAGMRQQALDDAKINRMADGLQGEARENFLNNITQLNSVSPALRDMFVDLADGAAQTEEAQMLMATSAGQSAMALAQQMKSGELSEAEFNNRLRALGPELDGFFGNMSQAQLQALETTNPAMYALAESAIGLNRLQEKSVKLTKDEQDKRQKLTDFTTSFQQVFVELQGKIKSLFLESPLFETLSDAFTGILEPVEGTTGIFDKIKPKLEEFMEWINGWVKQFMADPVGTFEEIKDNIVQALKDGVTALFSNFLPGLDTILIGALAGIAALFAAPFIGAIGAVAVGLAAMFGWETVKEKAQEGWDAITGVFTGIKDWWNELSFSEMFQGAWDSVTGIFSGIKDWWSNLSFSGMLTDAWNGIKEWFGGLFDFDISLPNFSDYLPRWMGGEGKSLGDLFGSDTPTEAAEVAASTPDEPAATTQTATAASPAQSMEQNEAVALNTTMQRMISLLEENNRLTRRTVNAIAESGNLQG